MSLRSWLRFAFWELSKLAVVVAAIVLVGRAASSGLRCAIVGDHCPLLLTPDGERLVTAKSRRADPYRYWTSGPVYVWNSRTGEQVAQLLNEDAVHAWDSPDGQHVVFTTANSLEAVDGRAGTIVTSPLPANWSDKDVDRLEMGDIIVLGSSQKLGDLILLDASTGAVVDRLTGRYSTGCVRGGSCLAAVRYEGEGDTTKQKIVLWDRLTKKTIGILPIQGCPIAISPDGRRIVVRQYDVGEPDPKFSVWSTDPSATEPLRKLGNSGGQCVFSSDGKRLLTLPPGESGTAELWNVEPNRRKRVLSVPVCDNSSAVFSGDGSRLAISTGNGRQRTELAVFETERGRLLWSVLWAPENSNGDPMFNRDGDILSAYLGNGEVHCFDAATGKILSKIAGRNDSADGESLSWLRSRDRRFAGRRQQLDGVSPGEHGTVLDRIRQSLGLKPAEPSARENWSMVGIADTSTGHVVFHHEANAQFETALLADGGSAVAIQSENAITIWDIKPQASVGGTITIILGVWLATFLAEILMRRLRKRADGTAPAPVAV